MEQIFFIEIVQKQQGRQEIKKKIVKTAKIVERLPKQTDYKKAVYEAESKNKSTRQQRRRHKQMQRYMIFLDWKNQYCQNDYTTQGNLQIQCYPYQNTKDIFHRTKAKYFKVCSEA